MSVEAIRWAYRQRLPASAKFVLVTLAEHANDNGGTCYPSIRRIADRTSLNRSTVLRTISMLEEKRLLQKVGRGPMGRTTLYRLMVAAFDGRTEGQVAGRDPDSCTVRLETVAQSDTEPLREPSVNPNVRNSAYSKEFEAFWQAYPKRVAKAGAWIAWKKEKPPLTSLLEALSWQKVHADWTRSDGQYIPNPATYLNQHRWEDDPPSARTYPTEVVV